MDDLKAVPHHHHTHIHTSPLSLNTVSTQNFCHSSISFKSKAELLPLLFTSSPHTPRCWHTSSCWIKPFDNQKNMEFSYKLKGTLHIMAWVWSSEGNSYLANMFTWKENKVMVMFHTPHPFSQRDNFSQRNTVQWYVCVCVHAHLF